MTGDSVINFSAYSGSLKLYLNFEINRDSVRKISLSDKPLHEFHSNEVGRRIIEFLDNGTGNLGDIKVEPSGTLFQRNVWNELRKIPVGETRTYSDIARAIGSPKAARAVGSAVASNKIVILIPCHRVVGKDNFGGYSAHGGLETKRLLLDIENRITFNHYPASGNSRP